MDPQFHYTCELPTMSCPVLLTSFLPYSCSIPSHDPFLSLSSTLSILFFTNACHLTSASPSLPLFLSSSLPLPLSPSPSLPLYSFLSPSLPLFLSSSHPHSLSSSLPLYSFLRVEYTSTQTPQERASSVDLISPSAFIEAKNAPQNYQVLILKSSLPLHFNLLFALLEQIFFQMITNSHRSLENSTV